MMRHRSSTMTLDKKYNLIALDLDGTVLNNAHNVTEKVRMALRQVVESGIHVVLASSRPPRSVLDLARYIGTKAPIIALGGGVVVNQNGDLFVLDRATITQENVKKIAALCKQNDITLNLYSEWNWYVDRLDNRVQNEIEIIGFAPTIVEAIEQLDCEPEKILIMGEPDSLQTFHHEISQQAFNIDTSFSKPTYYEITAANINKATALSYVCQQLNVLSSETIAVGDNFNDLDMLEWASLGVAMDNAPAKVKAIADLTIGGNDEDGVAYFVQEVFLQSL